MGDQLQIVPACNNVQAQYVEMRVPLYSHGCERKVKKALAHTKGICSVNVDFEQQKVTVWGICNKYDVLATMRKKRKDACFWKPGDNQEIQELQAMSSTNPQSHPSSLIAPPKRFKSTLFTLTKAKSTLNWKAWKRMNFIRSYSF